MSNQFKWAKDKKDYRFFASNEGRQVEITLDPCGIHVISTSEKDEKREMISVSLGEAIRKAEDFLKTGELVEDRPAGTAEKISNLVRS